MQLRHAHGWELWFRRARVARLTAKRLGRWRRVWAGQALVEDALIVDDHQRIPAELRTCLDCGELACRARITIPEAV